MKTTKITKKQKVKYSDGNDCQDIKYKHRRVYCECTAGLNCTSFSGGNSSKEESPTSYFLGGKYNAKCPVCGMYYFFFKKGGPKDSFNRRFLPSENEKEKKRNDA